MYLLTKLHLPCEEYRLQTRGLNCFVILILAMLYKKGI